MRIARRARRPRLLYLAFYFPPSRASGVYRARATANHFAAKGWDVTVLAVPLKFLHEVIGSTDESLLATVDPRVRVERPPMRQFIWEKNIRQFSRFRRNLPVTARRLHNFGQRHVFPERYSSWAWSAVRQAVGIHSRKPFDVVLATGNPFSSFAAAWMISRITGLPYVVDYRDSWTLDLFADQPGHPPESPVWAWEKRLLKHASGIVFVNDALRGWHADRYPDEADRMIVVPNGWDPDLMPIAADAGHDPMHPTHPVRFAYLGTLSSAQPVEEMGAAWLVARQHPELADAELNLYGHMGFFKGSHSVILERLGVHGYEIGSDDFGLHYRGPVNKTDVAKVYDESDVLVFLVGGGRYVTSGKIFEYMATGRPIVSVHGPGIAAGEVLAGYPLWFNANSLDPDAIAKTMVDAARAARELTPELRAEARRHAERFTRDRMLVTLEERMRALLPKRARRAVDGDAG